MTRSEFVRRLVLNEVCDDFENVDQIILPHIAKVGAICGLRIQRSEIVDALTALVDAGLVKAYDLSATDQDPFAGEIAGMPPLDAVEEGFRTHFYVTKSGMDCHLAGGSWWPLDDNERLRPGWEPPLG